MVFHLQPDQFALVVQQAGCGAVVDQQSAPACGRAGQRQRQTRIVKLAIPILHPTFERAARSARPSIGQQTQGFVAV